MSNLITEQIKYVNKLCHLHGPIIRTGYSVGCRPTATRMKAGPWPMNPKKMDVPGMKLPGFYTTLLHCAACRLPPAEPAKFLFCP